MSRMMTYQEVIKLTNKNGLTPLKVNKLSGNNDNFSKLKKNIKTITCSGENCPLKNDCFRYLILNSTRYKNRAMLAKIHYENGKCPFFFKRYEWQLNII